MDKWTLWDHGLPEGIVPRVVVAISYVTGRDGLMKATEEHFADALRLAVSINDPDRICVAHSCCSYPFRGAEMVERSFKNMVIAWICRDKTKKVQIIEGEPMINTVVEAQNIKKALDNAGINPRSILVVTSQAHSRSSFWIYSRLFPNAKIYLRIFKFENEYQADQPIPDQRRPWKWFIMNVLRQCALWVFGLNFVAKIKHAVPKEPKD